MNSETFSAVATCYRFLNPRIHRPRLRLSDAWLRWKPRQDVPPKWQAEGHGVVEVADSPAEAHRRWCASVDRQLHEASEAYQRMIWRGMQNDPNRYPWNYRNQIAACFGLGVWL